MIENTQIVALTIGNIMSEDSSNTHEVKKGTIGFSKATLRIVFISAFIV